jgi:hypothetical protein
MRTLRSLLTVVGIVAVVACASPVAPSPSAAAGMPLRQVQGASGCDTIGISYRTATFKIDPTATDPVTAITDEGTILQTYWSPGFQGGPADDPVVRDPAGQVVAADGDVVEVPDGAYPRLEGYFVCLAPDALYIYLADAS